MEQVVRKQSIFSILFGNNDNIENEDVKITDENLIKAMENADKMGEKTIESVVTENKASKNDGGFSNIKTEKEMKKTLEKMRKNLENQKAKLENQERDDR